MSDIPHWHQLTEGFLFDWGERQRFEARGVSLDSLHTAETRASNARKEDDGVKANFRSVENGTINHHHIFREKGEHMRGKLIITVCAVAIAFAGQALALDQHYKCYKVKKVQTPFPATVSLVDSIGGAQTAEVKKAFLYCNPVSKNGSLITDAAGGAVGYKIKADKQESTVNTTNQFGATSLVAKKAFILLVPPSP